MHLLGRRVHPVITTKPEERRAQRLVTPTPLDNRISYDCINVPAKFFDNVVRAAFTGTNGIVYVLTETRPAREVFASYDVDEHARLQGTSQPVSVHATAPASLNCVRRPACTGDFQRCSRRRRARRDSGRRRESSGTGGVCELRACRKTHRINRLCAIAQQTAICRYGQCTSR